MEDNDEGVPLLESQSEPSRSKQKQNPLPWPQLSIVLFIKACDALVALSIQPYINQVRTTGRRTQVLRFICHCLQLVGGLDIIGGDKRKVGYYVGLIVSPCY